MSRPTVRIRDYPVYKIVVGGEPKTGKTTLLKLASGDTTDGQYRPTVGIDFHQFNVRVKKRKIRSIFYDMGGESRFKGVREPLYRGTRSGILTFDLSRPESLLRVTEWYKEIRAKAGNVPLLLVGTRKPGTQRKIDRATCERVAEKLGAQYAETELNEPDEAVNLVKEAILQAARGTVVAH